MLDDEKKELLRVIGILDKANHNFQNENKEYSAKLQKAKTYIKYFVGILKNLRADNEKLVIEAENFIQEE